MTTVEMLSHKLPERSRYSLLPDLDDDQFAQWSELLQTRLGIVLTADRKPFFMSGLRTRMREIGCVDYQAYYDRLCEPYSSLPEWAVLIDRLTIHETRFFRDPDALQLLSDTVVPAFCARMDHSLQAWSVGCATGEEAYSLAMVLDQALDPGGRTRHHFGITATDISRPALETARQAEYPVRRLAGIPSALQSRYCEPVEDNRFRIVERLRGRICFSQLNIVDLDRFPLDGFDLIYCQNVLIYFARKERKAILDRLAARLAPGGVLVIAPGDVLNWSHPQLQRIRREGTLAYQRRVDPEARD